MLLGFQELRCFNFIFILSVLSLGIHRLWIVLMIVAYGTVVLGPQNRLGMKVSEQALPNHHPMIALPLW